MSKPKFDDYPFELRPLTKAEGGGWLITWPDLPGCMSDGETPEEALEALENLYYRHQVVAVIGPLLSRGIDKVTMRAQELGLPLLMSR